MSKDATKQMIAWWDQVASDHALKPLCMKVAFKLGHVYVNRGTGDAWPHQATLAKQAGVSREACQRALYDLEARGHLEIEVHRGRSTGDRPASNRYRPILSNADGKTYLSGVKCSNSDAFKPALTDAFKCVQNEPQMRTKRGSKCVRNDAQNHLNEPSEEPRPADAVASRRFSASDGGRFGADVRTDLFNRGLDILIRISGLTQSRARSMIGSWLKQVRDDGKKLLRAIEDADEQRVADPIAWITAALKARELGGGSKPEAPSLTHEQWAGMFARYRQTNSWPPSLGPAPGQPGCIVPSAVLRLGDAA